MLTSVRVVAGVLLFSIAGCASIPMASPGVSSFSVRGHAAKNGELYVSDFYQSEILIYPSGVENPAPSGEITAGISNAYNLAVDKNGTLYVQNNNNTVTEYPQGKTTPSRTLYEPKVGYGTGICVAVGRDGMVYTADHLAGQVYEFKKDKTDPSTTLNVSEAFGLALDRQNDLYVGWSNSSSGASGHVKEFKPGSKTGTDLGITVKYSGGLAIDRQNDLLVGDQGNNVIDVFKQGATTPFRTIDVSPYYPYQFALDHNDKYLYLVSGNPAAVYVYDYATGDLAWTDTQGLPGSEGYAEGVAVFPAQRQ
jgi:hypothetical protein